MKRILAFVLTAFILFSVASCGGAKTPGDLSETKTTVANNTSETTAPSKTEALGWEDSGVPKTDYEGYEFRFISATPALDNPWWNLTSDEETGEPLNDALYERSRKLEDVFNIKISVNLSAAPATDIPKSINSGDNTFDAIFTPPVTQLTFAQSGFLVDLYTLPYVNLEKSWWDQDLIREMSIKNKLFFATGDISPLMNIRIFSLVFNKDMCKELGLDYPYDLVLDGSWTMDTFSKYVRNVNKDMNGDGVMDYSDRWGFFSEWGVTYMMYISAGGRIAELDDNAIPQFVVDTEKNVNIASKALGVSIDKQTTLWANDYVANHANSWPAASDWYASGNALIRSSAFEAVPRDYRTMETDFGILPFPKYDDNQDKYYSLTAGHTGYVLSVPVVADNLERTGMILEAMAAESVPTVSKAFYEVCLEGKYIRDNESAEMLDIMFGNKIYDLGQILNLGGFTTQIVNLEKAGNTDLASMYASIKNIAQATLDKLVESLDD